MLCPVVDTTHRDQFLLTGVAPEDSSKNDQGPRKHEERLKKLEVKLEENELSFYPWPVGKDVIGLNCNRRDSV